MTPRYCGGLIILLALATLGGRPQGPVSKPEKLKPQPIPIFPAEEVWAVQLEAPPSANAWMDEERVYVPLQGEGLRALARKTGDVLWTNEVDITQPPLAIDDQLLIALPDELRALDPATGQMRWSHRLTRQLAAPLSASEDRVMLFDGAGEAAALRARDGAVVWRRSLGAIARHAPAHLPPHIVVVTLDDARVMALDGRTGEALWHRSLPGALSAPAIARDRVLVGATNNFFYALDAESGAERWRWRTGGDIAGAAASGERVFFVSLDNVLRAVDRDSGNQLWKAAIPSRPTGPPVAFDDVVVVAGVALRVDAFNARTGAVVGAYWSSVDLEGVPLIDTTPKPFEVAVVAVTRDGRVSALRPTGLMFPDPPLVPLPKLPGRELPREPRPGAVRLP